MIKWLRFEMLPDYPDFKCELQRSLLKRFEMLIDRKAPLMARIRRHRQPEGDKFVIEDEEGNTIRKDFVKFEARVEIPISLPIAQAASTSVEQFERAAEIIAAQSV